MGQERIEASVTRVEHRCQEARMKHRVLQMRNSMLVRKVDRCSLRLHDLAAHPIHPILVIPVRVPSIHHHQTQPTQVNHSDPIDVVPPIQSWMRIEHDHEDVMQLVVQRFDHVQQGRLPTVLQCRFALAPTHPSCLPHRSLRPHQTTLSCYFGPPLDWSPMDGLLLQTTNHTASSMHWKGCGIWRRNMWRNKSTSDP